MRRSAIALGGRGGQMTVELTVPGTELKIPLKVNLKKLAGAL